ncbi:MAG: T9SS type A sorting domain-containing protein [Ignavibacteria bacterium]|nr:T9SS type A sorting domain-containing protein [Ignavibacteria bacterium]
MINFIQNTKKSKTRETGKFSFVSKINTTVKVILTSFLILISLGITDSFATIYYSKGNLSANSISSWTDNTSGTGKTPSNFTSGDNFIIQSGDTMTTSASWTISGFGSSLTINSGGSLTLGGNLSLRDFTINGSLIAGAYLVSASTSSRTFTINGTLTTSNANGLSGSSSTTLSSTNSPVITIASTSKIVYNSTSAQNITATTYGLLEISGNGTKSLVGATTTNSDLIIGANSTLALNGKTLNLNDTLVYNGTMTGSTTSNLVIGGTGNNVTLPSLTLGNFTVNRTSGVTLSGDITISGTLTMSSGNITTGNNLLTLGTSSSTIGTLTYTTGRIIGSFKRWFNTLNVSNVLFPVGTSSTSRLVALTRTNVNASTGAGYLTAKFVTADPGNNNTSALNDNGYTVNRFTNQGYWEIIKDTNSINMTGNFNLNLETTGFSGINKIDSLRIIKRTSAAALWVMEGTHTAGVSTTAKRSGMSTFGQFTLGGNTVDNPLTDSPLPVTLSSFTSFVKSNNVTLNWSTANESNNKGFDIERKDINGYEYVKAGYVAGNGTTNHVSNYSFIDSKLNAGKYSYRIKQTDLNGNYEYFSLNANIEIVTPGKFNLSQNYPNPFNPTTKIDYEIPADSKVQIKIYDISGKEVMQLVNLNQKAGYYTIQFNAGSLSSGTYFYKLIAGSDVITKKMTLIK